MREIKKTEGFVTVIQTIDDNNNLIKIDIESKEPENEYHFIGDYEYNSENLLSRYKDNEGREIIFDFDSNNRVSWKRLKYLGHIEMIHYIYNEKDEVIKVEHQYGNGINSKILIGELIHSEDKVEVILIETDDLNKVRPFIEYSKKENIAFNSETNHKVSYKYIFGPFNEEQLDEFKTLLELDNIKGVD